MQMQINSIKSIACAKSRDLGNGCSKRKTISRYFTPNKLSGFVLSIVRGVIVLGLCFIILYPFLIKIINAFKGYNDFYDPTVRFIPKDFTIKNIVTVIEKMQYWTALRNTAFISITSAILQTLVCASVGYGFARFKFKGNGILFALSIFTLMVPPQTIIIPIFLRFRFFLGLSSLNLIDTPFPMIIMAATCMGLKNGLFVFLFRQLFKNMPKELEEAAYLDGCGVFKTYTKVMLPEAGSMLLTVFLLSFSWQWTDTVYNSLIFRDYPMLSNHVLSVGTGEIWPYAPNYVSIASLLAIIPIALVYAIAQKSFVQSVSRSGIVG